ncbi:hypothetical protein GmHk_06G017071 [Glycine max]|nr:hypothetical protein GmHk_06G017071 [Glycine max]
MERGLDNMHCYVLPQGLGTTTTIIQESRDLKNLAWDELIGILRVHEVHLQSMEYFQKKNFTTLKSEETNLRRNEKKDLEFDGSDNSNGSTDDEEALMSKKFKLMMKKKEKFQHSSR